MITMFKVYNFVENVSEGCQYLGCEVSDRFV